jgi:abnormal spindle-like microcephaly-associated protein
MIIQKRFRAARLGQVERKRYVARRDACMKIQAAVRGHVARLQYMKKRESAIKLQAAFRGFRERQRYARLQQAALVVQRRYRAKWLRSVFRQAFLMIRSATVVIQAYRRGQIAREERRRRMFAVLKLQAWWKGCVQRKRYAVEKQAVVTIQRWYRATRRVRQAKTQFVVVKNAVVTLQKAWREHRLRQVALKHQAAVLIQSHVRRMLAQRSYRRDVTRITHLQALCRGFLTRREVAMKRAATHKIQAWWQATVLARRCRREFLLQVGAAVVMQSLWRGYRVRVYYRLAVQHVVKLQALFRGCVQRRKYLTLRDAAVFTQRKLRAKALCRKQREAFLAQRASSVILQRTFRGWRERERRRRVAAAVCLQSYVRMLSVRREYQRVKTAAVTLQSAVRACQARQELKKKKAAVLCIQVADTNHITPNLFYFISFFFIFIFYKLIFKASDCL